MKKHVISLSLLSLLWVAPAWADDAICGVDESPAKVWSRVKGGGIKASKTSVPRKSVYPMRVIASSGDVGLERNGVLTPVAVGQLLQLNDVIATGRNGFISARLGDGTVSSLPPNAKIRLLQVDAYTARYDLLNGRVESRVVKSPNAKKNTFEIRLPTISVGVRGTHFWVANENGAYKTEVLDGLVQVRRRNTCSAPLMLAAGQGARLDDSKWEAKALLPAPELIDSQMAQVKSSLVFDLKPVAGAQSYVAQVAKDARFLDVVAQYEGSQSTIVASAPELDDGYYFVRVMAQDAQGLRGQTEEHLFLRHRK